VEYIAYGKRIKGESQNKSLNVPETELGGAISPPKIAEFAENFAKQRSPHSALTFSKRLLTEKDAE
jgi:hypothetical protein